LDIQMRSQGRHICLLIDNFSSHSITYEPKNIHLEFFEPNLTSFVQPLDAGVIRCFKAHYRCAFCIRALDLDEAGECDIYKINLLEGMMMAREAWNAVEPSTIKNCWDHTDKIPPPATASTASSSGGNLHSPAWDIICEFATTDMIFPHAEDRLKELL
jgi:hypothetical protein